MQCAFSLRMMREVLCGNWEQDFGKRNAEETEETGGRGDGVRGEGGPGADLTDVPPEVLGVGIA